MSIPFLSGQLWKIATGGAAVIALIMGVFLFTSYAENRSLSKARNELSKQINDPITGYVAQLSQSRTNVVQLESVLQAQNDKIVKLSAESQALRAQSERALAVAKAETKAMERKLAGFLATKPQGVTLEDRVRDIDERAMKEFLP